jgi:hypothetical protein
MLTWFGAMFPWPSGPFLLDSLPTIADQVSYYLGLIEIKVSLPAKAKGDWPASTWICTEFFTYSELSGFVTPGICLLHQLYW